MEQYITLFGEYVANWGYYIIFTLSFLENSIFLGFFVPGEITTIIAGFYAGQGVLNWGLVVLLVAISSMLGDAVGFYLGRIKGKRWLNKLGKRFGFTEEKIEKSEEFWVDFGGKAVFFARFIAFARTFIPFLAGASKLKKSKFFFYDFSGALIHATLMVTLGYFFGENWERILSTFGFIGFILLAVLLGTLYRYLLKKGVMKLEKKINED